MPSAFVARLRAVLHATAAPRRLAAALALALLVASPVSAQELLSGGDGAITQFSGLDRAADGTPRPNPDGAVLRLFGLANPDLEADGALREPPRLLLSRTARELGQVFGVAFDDRSPANIYVAASSVFGLYRTPDGRWADGMWGPGGGPGTIWKLNAARGYRAERFADIGYLDAPNRAAGLGALAYDRWHGQLFVSDLETGLIHRLDLRDGELLESFDHGVDGRAFFLDAATGEETRLEPVAHDPTGQPRFEDCAVEFEGVEDAMPFDSAPECWNFADFRRRAWGLGVFRDGEDGPVRLYYAVWGGAGLGSADWPDAEEDATTSIWSVALTGEGWFDATDVRREIVLPPLGDDGDTAANGGRPPVTNIAFTEDGDMVLAERGAPAPYFEEPAFTQLVDPHNARVLLASRDAQGRWEIEGRYDAGYPPRREGPEIRANAAGGIAVAAGGQGMAWLTVDALCGETGPCPHADSGEASLSDRVGGLQATPFEDVQPLDAEQDDALGLARSYLYAVRGAGRIPGDMGAIALHPGDAPPVRLVERPERPRRPEPPPPAEPDDEVAEVGTDEPDVEPEEEVEAPDEDAEEAEADEPREAQSVATDLGVSKSALEECRPGEECRFEVSIENRGNTTFDGPIMITNTLGSASVGFVSSRPDAWRCHAAGGQVFCHSDRLRLAPAEATSLALTLRLPANYRQPRLENCGAIVWLGRSGRERIRAVQAELTRRGFDAGPADGAMGPRTAGAIRQAESAFDLPASGDITADLVEAMFGEGAWLTGDADDGNDRSCATATVDVPAPPPAPPAQPRPPAQAGPPARHHPEVSVFHQRRASAQHNPATSAPTPIHRRAFSEFHMRYRSSQHDGIRSEFVARHDRVMSRFHQRFESQFHDIETSGPVRFHTMRDSGQADLHDGYTSRRVRVHEGWTSRWR